LFLLLSKTLDLLVAPLSWVLALVAAGALLRRRARLSSLLLAAALLTAVVFSSQPVANQVARYMEAAPGTFQEQETYDALIVLGGLLDPEATKAAGRPQYQGAVERILEAARLLRQGHARFALVSGGLLEPEPGVAAEAEVLRDQLVELGVEEDRIVVEGRSRNTRENAQESARIVRDRGWKRLVLVTSAAHMPRAAGCFRAAGLEVDTYPVDYHLATTPSGPGGLLPRAGNLSQTTDLIRELVGRWVYRLLGYTKPAAQTPVRPGT
jgi:uncharacterized SAM-binding protein YcdF (DUF218 family)